MSEVFKASNEQETIKFAKSLGQKLKGGDIIELIGDMGSGKTTFVKGLAQGAGYDKDVTSPTFTIQQIYPGRVDLYHYDFYRLQDPGILSSELEEALENPGCAIVVEWGETLSGVLPGGRIRVSIKTTGENNREIKLTRMEA